MTKEHAGRSDMSKAAVKRRADAWELVRAGRFHTRGAAYLGGYAIECKLKAAAMEAHGVWSLPQLAARLAVDERDVYTHGLEALLEHIPARDRFRQAPVWRDFVTQVNHWRPSWRYEPRDWTVERAETFLRAVDRVFKWLSDNS